MRQRLLPEGSAQCAVAITSWSAGEGKTTVTANLAWALAASGRAVVVVDCDLRRPRVYELLDVSGERGIADVGRGASVVSMIQDTAVETLQVIPAGVPHRHPSDTVHVGLQRVLAVLRDCVILIDTPPLFAAETTEIAQAVGGLVLFADVRQRKAGDIDEALTELTEPGTRSWEWCSTACARPTTAASSAITTPRPSRQARRSELTTPPRGPRADRLIASAPRSADAARRAGRRIRAP